MISQISKSLASLIIDQWPLPSWLSRRIRSNRDVAEAIEEAEVLEGLLRNGAGEMPIITSHKTPVIDTSRRLARESITVHHRIRYAALLSVAATLLLCVGIYVWHSRPQTRRQAVVPAVTPVDLKPILASLSAGEIVAKKVTSGFQEVALQLSAAGNQIGHQFPELSASRAGILRGGR